MFTARANWLLRPSLAKSFLGSLCVHVSAWAAILVLQSWGLVVDPPSFGGSQRVVQLQLRPTTPQQTPPQTTAVRVDAVNPIPEPQAAIVPTYSDTMHTPITDKVNVTKQQTDRPPTVVNHSPLVEVPIESNSNLEKAPAANTQRIRDRSETKLHTTSQNVRPIPRRDAAIQPPTPSVSLPQIAGTDDKTPPDFAGNPKPAYPAEAYLRGIEGEVLLRLFISESGEVERVTVAKSSGYAALDNVSVETISTWRGRPARHGGIPVPTVELLPIHFRLDASGQ